MGLLSNISNTNTTNTNVGNSIQSAPITVPILAPAPIDNTNPSIISGSGTYTPDSGSGTYTPDSGSGTYTPDSGSGTYTPEDTTIYYLLGENEKLRDIYNQLTNSSVQKTIQHTEHQQKKTSSFMTINYVLFILFYVACILFAFMFFYMTTNASILGMSIYTKVGIFLVVITYPFWVSLLDQVVMFVVRYLYALAMGVPYIKGIRQ